MKRVSLFLIALTASEFATPFSWGAPAAVTPAEFDLNGNGSLEESEARAMFRHMNSALYRAADEDRDGTISAAEKAAYFATEEENLKAVVDQNTMPEYAKKFQGKPVALAEADKKLSEFVIIDEADQRYMPLGGIQIRRTLQDIDPNRNEVRNDRQAYAQSLAKAKAAEFGFVSNGISGDDSWLARGVIARPFTEITEGGVVHAIVPSIQFDRVTHSQAGAGEIDTLIFGIQGVTTPDNFGPGGQISADIRYGLTYATDFDFDTSIPGGYAEVEPVFGFGPLGNGAYVDIMGDVAQYRTRQYLRVEGGSIDDSDTLAQSEYFRGGAGVGIEFRFADIDRLTFSAEYRYYFDFLGNNDDFTNVRPSIQWQLDEVGHLTLQAAYENGLIPITQQEIDLFSITLGIKF